MEIYILRHGIAEPRGARVEDEKRALTKEGIEKLRRVLAVAREAKVAPAVILTSPYLRALQTAEAASVALGAKIVQTDSLKPESSPQEVWDDVRGRHEKSIMLVGHEPLLGQTLSFLLGASWALVDLKKGALARIEVEQSAKSPRGVLEWVLTPKLATAVTQ